MKNKYPLLVAAPLLFVWVGLIPAHAAVDAGAAQDLLKSEKCTKCHSADRDKTGPSLKKMAAKYKGKADAEATLVKFVASGAKVKLDDGTEEEHMIIKVKDAAQLKNLAQYILSR